MRTVLRTLLLLLLASTPAFAQTVQGTVSWTMTRPGDLTGFHVKVDTQPDVDLGLPPTNSAPLALTVGTHQLTVIAIYADASQLASAPTTVTVSSGPNTPMTVTNITPVSGTTGHNNQVFPVSVTATDDSGIKSVKLHWIFNGSDNTGFAITKTGNVYSASPLPSSGPGNRTWYFTITANDGEVVNTPQATAVITN